MRPLVVYLDMNLWVALARGRSQGDEHCEKVRRDLVEAVKSGTLVVPLSAAHYLELWHRRDRRSREEVGALMRRVSDFTTLASPTAVRRSELRGFLSEIAGAAPATRSDLLGRGAAHAFGSADGRFRFVESLASPDGVVPEGPPTPPPAGWYATDRCTDAWEWLQLVGLQGLLENEGVDRTPEHRFGSTWRARELDLRQRLSSDKRLRGRLWDYIVTEELIALLDDINELCEEFSLDPRRILLPEHGATTPPAAMRALVGGLPSTYTWATLRLWKHRDLTHPWEQHDWTDMTALSVALPYCDIVITERRWAHLARASGLAARYGTDVSSGVSALEAILDRLH
jgi:hypothetical protein